MKKTSNCFQRAGFTLIELLVVVGVIAVLASFTFYAMSAVKKKQHISHAQAELGQVAAAIDSYHDAYGFYPPDNWADGPYANQLYYELVGTTLTNNVYTTLDGGASISALNVTTAFPGAGEFLNCNKPGATEDTRKAKNFIHELKPSQVGTAPSHAENITNLVTSVGGPDSTYRPLGVAGVNPWRYRSSGALANNPGSYELWIQLSIGGKTYLICNWSKTVQINNTSLP